jgi:carbon monoxide dehydrogenase subunit G
MTRVRLTSSVLVARPPAAVWDYLVDWRRQSEWIALTDVVPIDDDAHRVGGRLSARTGFGRLGFTDPMTITAWDPPYRLGLRHTGRVVRGEATALVEPAGTNTKVGWEELIDVPGGAVGSAGVASGSTGQPASARLDARPPAAAAGDCRRRLTTSTVENGASFRQASARVMAPGEENRDGRGRNARPER